MPERPLTKGELSEKFSPVHVSTLCIPVYGPAQTMGMSLRPRGTLALDFLSFLVLSSRCWLASAGP